MKKTILLLPILFLFMSQRSMTLSQQTRPAVLNAIENFFETPFEWFANRNARRQYAEFGRETLATPLQSNEIACDPNGIPLPPSALTDLLNLPHVRCQCEPWGNCLKEACACETLCPKNFNILRRPGQTTIDQLHTPENSFAFNNFSDAGICWGHATMTQKFNRLAFFRPDQQPPHSLTSTDPDERRRAIRYYRDLIDDIADNKPVDIPGYASLEAFSDDPELQNYIMDKVVDEWADRAMSWQGLSIATQSAPRSREHNERIVAEVRQRLQLNQQPNIVFTYNEQRFLTHSLLVSHIQQKEGREVMCLRDNNYSALETMTCSNYMYMDENGELVWKVFYSQRPVGGINIAFNDDRDAVKQVKNLHKKCKREKGCR